MGKPARRPTWWTMLRQVRVGPITMTLVFLVTLRLILPRVLLLPVGLTRQAPPLLNPGVSLRVLWKGLQQVEVHPVEQVRTFMPT